MEGRILFKRISKLGQADFEKISSCCLRFDELGKLAELVTDDVRIARGLCPTCTNQQNQDILSKHNLDSL